MLLNNRPHAVHWDCWPVSRTGVDKGFLGRRYGLEDFLLVPPKRDGGLTTGKAHGVSSASALDRHHAAPVRCDDTKRAHGEDLLRCTSGAGIS